MTFSIKTRKNTVDKLKNEELDLLVIGGGITGAGVAPPSYSFRFEDWFS